MLLLPAIAQGFFSLSQAPGACRFFASFKNARDIQKRLLLSYLRKNKNTLFGREHGFSEIRTLKEYGARVPIRSYDQFLPYIERIKRGESGILTSEDVILLQPTGGTTGTKLIPYTLTFQKELNRALAPWFVSIAGSHARILTGRAYWSITPPRKETGPSSLPLRVGFREDSEYFGWKGVFLRSILAVPPSIAGLSDMEDFRLATLYFLLREKNLTWMSIWSPTYLLTLLRDMEKRSEELVSSIARGAVPIERKVGALLAAGRRPMKKRALELERLLHMPAGEAYSRIWPRLAFISLWMDGYARRPAGELAELFRKAHFQGKGLLATEGVVTIPVNPSEGCVPAFTSHFLEFSQDEGGQTRCLWELEEGERYSVVLSTGGGLYRYAIGDVVVVKGFFRGLPLLSFLGREGTVCDLVGEKLEGRFVEESLEEAIARSRLSFRFLMLAPDTREEGFRYTVFLESAQHRENILAFTRELEQMLERNFNYAHAVRLGQLLPVSAFVLSEDGHEAFLRRCVADGQRLGDIKPLMFDSRTDWKDHFQGNFVTD